MKITRRRVWPEHTRRDSVKLRDAAPAHWVRVSSDLEVNMKSEKYLFISLIATLSSVPFLGAAPRHDVIPEPDRIDVIADASGFQAVLFPGGAA